MAIVIVKGDTGTVVRRELIDEDGVTVDISSALAAGRRFYFISPTGVVKDVEATYTTDGTDGQLQYIIASSDIDEVGPWRLQVRINVTGTGGFDQSTQTEDWAQVHERLV